MSDKVLLVDDEPQVINAIRRALQDEEYDILSANSAAEALEIMAGTSIDVIVSDEKMPEMSGTELLTEVSRIYPDTIRIILTGHASMDVIINAVNKGEIYRFLTKPWNDIDLAISIRHALQRKKLITHNTLLKKKVDKQSAVIKNLEQKNPGITKINKDSDGTIIVDEIEEIDELLKPFLSEEEA